MHHRIPKSKRHKKLKAVDPCYTGDRTKILDKNAGCANVKPKHPDAQEIPKKLLAIMNDQKAIKEGKFKKKRKKRTENATVFNEGDDYGPGVKGCIRKPQPIPVYKKEPGETNKNFLRRVDSATQNALIQSKIEDKFSVEISREVDGKCTVGNIVFDEKYGIDGKINKPHTSEGKKLKRKKLEEKKKLKKKAKVEEQQINELDNEKDHINFGEVVLQPPALSFLPRKASGSKLSQRKPGAKPLLLKQLIGSKDSETDKNRVIDLHGNSFSGKTDRTVKRKYLSVADRRKLDIERNAAVIAYRQLKKIQNFKKTQ